MSELSDAVNAMRAAAIEAIALYDVAVMAAQFTKPGRGQVIVNVARAEKVLAGLRGALSQIDDAARAEGPAPVKRWKRAVGMKGGEVQWEYSDHGSPLDGWEPAPVSAPLDREGVETDPEKPWLWFLNERLGGYQTVFDAISKALDRSNPSGVGISVISFMEGIWPQVTKAYSALTGQQDQVGGPTPAVFVHSVTDAGPTDTQTAGGE